MPNTTYNFVKSPKKNLYLLFFKEKQRNCKKNVKFHFD